MGSESLLHREAALSHEGACKEVVSALIVRGNKVLLMRRAAHEPFAGCYELPGGTVEGSETHQDALMREVVEETGLAIRAIGELLGVSEFSTKPDVCALNFVYHLELEEGVVTLSIEHDDYCFIDVDEAQNLPLTDNARRALAMLQKPATA